MTVFSRIPSLLALLVGALASWAVRPSIWLAVGGPIRWLWFIAMTAWTESRFNGRAVGDGGRSLGILQFVDGTREALNPGWGTEDWYNCARQGWAAGQYVQGAIANSPRLILRLRLPFPFGPASFRNLWTCGGSATCTARPWWDSSTVSSGAPTGVLNRFFASKASIASWAVAGLLMLPLFIGWAALLLLPAQKWTGRTRRRRR